ncbi:MAG TPA: alpha/beta hydrolase [Ornithinibacter sp.]|nr:alpha/beta hydrolase [Ornithinibacter sp.]
MTWRRVSLPDAALEVAVRGSGEPLVLVQTALTADELLPVAQQPVLDGFRVVLYHRRGYAGSTPAQGPGSIERDARDAEQLLAALDISRAHVVGLSFSSAIAMRLAASAPGLVHTLTLIEPPPTHSLEAREFVADLVEQHRTRGTDGALDLFMRRIVGPDWRRDTEQHLPGGTAQVERDADTFFRTDVPALQAWRLEQEEARHIRQPVLHLGGTDSGAWFEEVRDRVLARLPQASDVRVPGADHSLALTHPVQVASAIASFLRAHPMSG